MGNEKVRGVGYRAFSELFNSGEIRPGDRILMPGVTYNVCGPLGCGPYFLDLVILDDSSLFHKSPFSDEHNTFYWTDRRLRELDYPYDWPFTQKNLLRRRKWEVTRGESSTPPLEDHS